MGKKRPPIKQLKEAGKIAREILKERKLETKESAISEILNLDKAPILPGIPAYLPHKWTIKQSQRIMYDLLKEWQLTSDSKSKQENITEFFTFCFKRLKEEEQKANAEIANTPKLIKMVKGVPLLKDVFSPFRKRDVIKAINKFFVDSFAVSIVAKSNSVTSEYAEWFLNWTNELHELWERKENNRNISPGVGNSKDRPTGTN